MSNVVSINKKTDESKRKLADYVSENCDNWEACLIIARDDTGGLQVVTSHEDEVEFIGMVEIAKAMLISGLVHD
jgi:aspartyl/asparaginyl-tRNA synthetase